MKEKEFKKKRFKNLRYDMKHNKPLLILCIPGIIWFLLFCYIPMIGLIIAFQKYNPAAGIFGSKFVGLENFRFFVGSSDFFRITFNTLTLNFLFILSTMVMSIVIAIVLSELTNKIFVKITQSVVILPHFISWTVVALLTQAFLNTDRGMVNQFLVSIGLEHLNFNSDAAYWPAILTILKIWQGAGYGSIVYLAAITGMDREIYEAARVDGANRLQCIRYLTLPLLKSTAILLFIMSVGKIFYGDFGMIYAIVGTNTLLYPTTDVIDTYIYRMLMESQNIGMSSAVGLYQSLMGFAMVLISNKIAKKASPESAIF
ncbi:ABC transporter permease subunit [Clostridium sp. HBUAS56010]|uniref:ABC transporter permease n=1 Tax=Clostridium sp. HBUAS56010 TaxID=2571127 RepID=UPI001FAB28F6|nr:ABC transporter permease subunit [Clostridium sp. HBUAS56010]